MNIARWFSYTRFVERELIRERRKHERECERWETERLRLEAERQRLENVVFLRHGVNAPHPHLAGKSHQESRPVIPRAIGPIGDFGLTARNATLREEQEFAKDRAAREVPPAPELSAEAQERIRKSAENKGVPLKGENVA